jgi:hypothetical protein
VQSSRAVPGGGRNAFVHFGQVEGEPYAPDPVTSVNGRVGNLRTLPDEPGARPRHSDRDHGQGAYRAYRRCPPGPHERCQCPSQHAAQGVDDCTHVKDSEHGGDHGTLQYRLLSQNPHELAQVW